MVVKRFTRTKKRKHVKKTYKMRGGAGRTGKLSKAQQKALNKAHSKNLLNLHSNARMAEANILTQKQAVEQIKQNAIKRHAQFIATPPQGFSVPKGAITQDQYFGAMQKTSGQQLLLNQRLSEALAIVPNKLSEYSHRRLSSVEAILRNQAKRTETPSRLRSFFLTKNAAAARQQKHDNVKSVLTYISKERQKIKDAEMIQ